MIFLSQGKARLASPVLFLALALTPGFAHAHGIAGNRVFPATLATDDPAAESEASLPTVAWQRNARDDAGNVPSETDVGGELDVLVAPDFALGIAPTWTSQTAKGEAGSYGFQNLEVSGKYQFYQSNEHEIIMSAGLVTDIGGSGSKRLNVDNNSTFTPTYYFGKGMGDLPDSLALLKPLAITGTIGVAVAEDRNEGDEFQPGIAIEYSLQYLKSSVKDYGLPEFVNHLVPVVEIPMAVGLDNGDHDFTGTVNPGVIYIADQWQFGVEAIVPLNSTNQHGTGVIGQFHVYLDDFLPAVFGGPIFGGNK